MLISKSVCHDTESHFKMACMSCSVQWIERDLFKTMVELKTMVVMVVMVVMVDAFI